MLPYFLGVKRVHADDHFGKILTLAERRLGTLSIGKTRLAKAADALVGIYLYGNETAQSAVRQIAFHACDFHTIVFLSCLFSNCFKAI